MNTKIVGISIAAFIGIIVLGSVLMPILNDSTATEDTIKNVGFLNAKTLDETTTATMSWQYTNPEILVVDGNEINISEIESSYSAISIVFSNDWFIRAVQNAGLILYKTGTTSASAIEGATVSSEKDFSMTVASGVATIVIGENTYEYTISGDGLIVTTEDNAPYVIKKSTDIAYLNGDSVVYAVGRTDRALNVSGSSFNAIFKASVDDGVTPISYSPQWTVTDSSVIYQENSDHLDLYDMTAFTVDLLAAINTGTVTYNQIFVPSEVTAERSIHFTDGQNAILSAIPIMIIVAILLGVVALVIRSRLD